MFDFTIRGTVFRIKHDDDSKTLEFGFVDSATNKWNMLYAVMSSDIGGLYADVKACIESLLTRVNQYLKDTYGGGSQEPDFDNAIEELKYRIANNLVFTGTEVNIKPW